MRHKYSDFSIKFICDSCGHEGAVQHEGLDWIIKCTGCGTEELYD